jgi:hypothetical protein
LRRTILKSWSGPNSHWISISLKTREIISKITYRSAQELTKRDFLQL